MSSGVDRIVETLEVVASKPDGVSVTEASRELSLSKAATSRLLASLAVAGLLERDQAQRYVLGLRLWEFGSMAARRLRITDIARSLLLQTANDYGTRLHLSVLRGDKAIFLEMTDFEKGSAVSVVPAIPTVPAYACAPGKVMLAGQTQEELTAALNGPLLPHTDRTITARTEFIEELRRVRDQGYAVNTGEYLAGHVGVAVPIHDYTGRVIAAVGCSGFAHDFVNGDPTTQLPPMRDLAASISALLGYKAGARTTAG